MTWFYKKSTILDFLKQAVHLEEKVRKGAYAQSENLLNIICCQKNSFVRKKKEFY